MGDREPGWGVEGNDLPPEVFLDLQEEIHPPKKALVLIISRSCLGSLETERVFLGVSEISFIHRGTARREA